MACVFKHFRSHLALYAVARNVLYHNGLKSSSKHVTQTRTLLSQAFYCDSKWRSRLAEPTLSKVSAEMLLTQLFIQFDKNGAATGVDMEVFANRVQDVHPSQLHLVESLLKRFRSCRQALSVVDSMSHGIIRAYIELNQTDRLLPLLQQKIEYGIFPDDFAFCLLLDHLIKSDNLKDASKVAIEVMLQGVDVNPTARLLALHSCTSYLWQHLDTLLAAFTEDDKPTLDEEEEEYVVVRFVPLYNFDDHFDITDERRLIGKTLAFLSANRDHPVYRSCELIGLAMNEKFNRLFALLEQYMSDTTASFHTEVLEILSTCLESCKYKTETIERVAGTELKEDSEYNFRHTVEERQQFIDKYQELKPKLTSCTLLDSKLLDDVKLLVSEGVKDRQQQDIEDYKALMNKWNEQRDHNVKLQERSFKLKERQEALDQKIEELTDKEMLLNYFVRQNEISIGLLKADKPKAEAGEVDDTEYVAEPGKRGKKRS